MENRNYISLQQINKFPILLWAIVIFSAFILYACEDTFEDDISDDTVSLLTPQDGYSFSDPNVSFWWNPVNGASSYNLKIIKIDTGIIIVPIQLILDSNITENQFQMSLSPGRYEWGIVAYNGGYETDYFYRVFYVDSTLDISGSTVTLFSPNDNYATKDSIVSFDWDTLYNADKYTLQIRQLDENGIPQLTLYDLKSTSIDTTVGPDGSYVWTVYADNNQSGTTTQKTWRNILIDRTEPVAPDLLRPENDSTIVDGDLEDSKVRFSWDKVSDSGSTINKYTLEISEDSLFVSLDFTTSVNDTFYLWQPSNVDTLYWRVNATDTVQNVGDFSDFNTFFIQ